MTKQLFCLFIIVLSFSLGPSWAQTETPTPEPEATLPEKSWNEKIATGVETPVPTPEPSATPVMDENAKMQQELMEIDQEVKAKGTHVLITDSALAKKMLKALSRNKGKNGKPLSPFATMQESEIEGMLLKQSAGTPFASILKDYPKIATFIVRFFKSEDAFLGLIKIASQDRKLKLYFGTFIFLALLSLLFNLMVSRNAPFWKRFLRKLGISLFITCLQFGAIYFFFSDELAPTIKIAKEVFFT